GSSGVAGMMLDPIRALSQLESSPQLRRRPAQPLTPPHTQQFQDPGLCDSCALLTREQNWLPNLLASLRFPHRLRLSGLSLHQTQLGNQRTRAIATARQLRSIAVAFAAATVIRQDHNLVRNTPVKHVGKLLGTLQRGEVVDFVLRAFDPPRHEGQVEPGHSERVHALARCEVADVGLRLCAFHEDHPPLLHDGLAIEGPDPRKYGKAIIEFMRWVLQEFQPELYVVVSGL